MDFKMKISWGGKERKLINFKDSKPGDVYRWTVQKATRNFLRKLSET